MVLTLLNRVVKESHIFFVSTVYGGHIHHPLVYKLMGLAGGVYMCAFTVVHSSSS